jgi:hypothetical protein
MRPFLTFFPICVEGLKKIVTNNNHYDRFMGQKSDMGIPLTVPGV